jgi:hypothetical protein
MTTLREITEAFKQASKEERKEFFKNLSQEMDIYSMLTAEHDALLEEQRKTYQVMHNFFTGARLMKMQRMYRFKKGGW